MTTAAASFLSIEGLHVLVTGSRGGIGLEAVREFLAQGCHVSALDVREGDEAALQVEPSRKESLQFIKADISNEDNVQQAVSKAYEKFGPINILIANAGVSDELTSNPIWEMSAEHWDSINKVNYRGTFLTIKHFIRAAENWQKQHGSEIPNLAIVVTGSECGKYGQEGHVDYASGKAALQYGLVPTVKNEIVRVNSLARINAVAPGWVNTPLIAGRLDDPHERWAETESTVALRKIAQPEDVARAMAFLASHRAAGHISGQTLSIDGGMEGRLLWKSPSLSSK